MKAKLKDALKLAMKAKDQVKMDTIRGILSALQYEEIQKGTEDLPSEAVLAILKSETKKRNESKEFAQQAGRADELAKLDREIAAIEEFLPSQLSSEALEKIMVELKSANPGMNMGLAMKALKEQHSGKYDGKLASELAKKIFA